MDGVYVDGRKDATLTFYKDVDGVSHQTTVIEEHYVVVGEPGELYLTHFTPEDGKGLTIANGLYKKIENSQLQDSLTVIGTDGTNTMTGPTNGFIISNNFKNNLYYGLKST